MTAQFVDFSKKLKEVQEAGLELMLAMGSKSTTIDFEELIREVRAVNLEILEEDRQDIATGCK